MAYFIKLLVLAIAVTAVVAEVEVGIRGTQNDDPFASFDKSGDGFLSSKEIQDLGIAWNSIASYDLNNDQKLSREEFSILEQVAKNGLKETNYLNHFRAADKNHDGFVTAEELQKRFQALGKRYTLRQITGFIRPRDKNNDGKFNYYEFRKALFNV